MSVAIIHDYLIEYGGAERVVEALHQIFPEAPVYVAFYDPDGLDTHKNRFKNWTIKTSWLQKVPFARRLISPFRIFAPIIFEGFDLRSYDLVISSSAIYFAKAVITTPQTLHLAYIHTPPRYLYGYTTTFNYMKHWWTRIGATIANHFLRLYDYEVSQRPDILIANSKNVAARINKIYRRKSTIIYPPVDVKNIINDSRQINTPTKDYFLVLSRLWGGKGLETIVEAFNQTKLPLKIIGSGPLKASLIKHSKSNIQFLDSVSDSDRIKYLTNAKALVLCAEDEDFGITAVESQAAGTPVIALKQGGYLETVIGNKTGVFFEEPTAQSLAEALNNFDHTKFKSSDCKQQALKFSFEVFKNRLLKLIEQNLLKS